MRGDSRQRSLLTTNEPAKGAEVRPTRLGDDTGRRVNTTATSSGRVFDVQAADQGTDSDCMNGKLPLE